MLAFIFLIGNLFTIILIVGINSVNILILIGKEFIEIISK